MKHITKIIVENKILFIKRQLVKKRSTEIQVHSHIFVILGLKNICLVKIFYLNGCEIERDCKNMSGQLGSIPNVR